MFVDFLRSATSRLAFKAIVIRKKLAFDYIIYSRIRSLLKLRNCYIFVSIAITSLNLSSFSFYKLSASCTAFISYNVLII